MQVFISLHLRVRQSFLIYRVSWRLIPIPYFSTHGKSHRYFPFQLFEPFLVPKELKSTFSFTTSTNTICPSSTVRISTYLFSGHFPFLSIAHSFEIKIRSVLLHQMLQLVISLISLTFLSYIPRELAVKGISFHRYKLEDSLDLLLNTLAA